jgi:predicted nucleotidyltransferase
MCRPRIQFDQSALADFFRRWSVRELALFGSVLTDEFTADSDVDVLVTFAPESQVSLWDWGPMMDELRTIFGRDVDLVEKSAVRNPFIRHHILSRNRVVYAA